MSINSCILFCLLLGTVLSLDYGVINAPVSDIRKNKTKSLFSYKIDRDQLSQLLYNEIVSIVRTEGDWLFIEALQQPNYDHSTKKWIPYTGYVQKSQVTIVSQKPEYNLIVSDINVAPIYSKDCRFGCVSTDISLYVSIGTMLVRISYNDGWYTVRLVDGSIGYILASSVKEYPIFPNNELVDRVVETADTMLGWYYFWGGRSNFMDMLWDKKIAVTGVDCSGLVSLSYKANGVILPRDADPQFRNTKNISNTELMMGDLLFFGDSMASHMTHVMLFGKNGYIIESTTSENANGTRTILFHERFGRNPSQITWGMPVSGTNLFWGRPILRSWHF